MKSKDFPAYTLRQVVELTGVSEYTLRGWESRYQAFCPRRTPSGRRLYSPEDLLRAKALFDLTARGHRIGQIATWSTDRLQSLSEQNSPEHKGPQALKIPRWIETWLKWTDRFEWDHLSRHLEKERQKLSSNEFIHDVILPFSAAVSQRVLERRLSIAQEHILSALIKENLFILRGEKNVKKDPRKRLVLATPEGDFHEIGLLVAANLASACGYSVLYLGPHVPKRDLCEASLRYAATHVLVASTLAKAEGAAEDLLSVIHFLDRGLPPSTALWIAGRHAAELKLSLQRPYFSLSSFADLESVLD